MNQLPLQILAELENLDTSRARLPDAGDGTGFTWFIICVIVALIILVAFKTSGRSNSD